MSNASFRRWTVVENQDAGNENGLSLKLNTDAELPKLGAEDVLVEMHAASLNYRDLAVLKVVTHQLSIFIRD